MERPSLSSRRLRFLPSMTAQAPWWVRLAIGAAAVVLGLLLAVRPLTSLTTLALYLGLSLVVSGVSDLLAVDRARRTGTQILVPSLWVVAGVVVMLWQGLTLRTLGLVVAVMLLLSGASRCLAAVRGRSGDPAQTVTAVLTSATELVLGVLALSWPDVTLLVLAVLFGVRTLMFGLTSIWAALSTALRRDLPSVARLEPEPAGSEPVDLGPADPEPVRPASSRPGRWTRPVVAAVALTLAVGTGVAGARLQSDSPVVDAFYASPSDVPDTPGQLLRAEPFTRGIPDTARAWRILYTTTTDTDDTPALASGVVVVAKDASPGPRPVVAFAHGTTGFATQCAPSLLPESLDSGALPALDQIIAEQWVLVATDYAGMGTDGVQPYLIGQGEARSTLDAVRAARQLDDIELSDETVIWGHSQGGHAALWAGQLAPSYAPDVPLAGVAAMAPASDVVALNTALPGVTGGTIFASFVIEAYSQTYPDVHLRDYVVPAARTLVREVASRCLADTWTLLSALTAVAAENDGGVFLADPSTGALGARLAENVPTGPVEAPLLIAQGLSDWLITPALQDSYVERLCASGQPVDHRSYEGRDHMSLLAADSPFVRDLVSWTTARFADEPATPTCAG